MNIKCTLESTAPFFIGRIAGIELLTAYQVENGLATNLAELENNAGIHVTDHESLRKYTTQLLKAYDHCSLIAAWDKQGPVYAKTGKGQDLIAERTPRIPKCDALLLEPYYSKNSWMDCIKGKHVLIIHPFVASIQQQLLRLKEIFPDRPWFEDCTFTVVAPPLTLAGNHEGKAWDTHLNTFLEKTPSNFDVALVAAGGYGMLIADALFQRGKSVMYVGGALQLFFGVIGKRWFENKEVMALVNDAWIRPLPVDKPAGLIKVERGCYW